MTVATVVTVVTVVTKQLCTPKNLNLPKTFLSTCLCDSSYSSDSSGSCDSSDSINQTKNFHNQTWFTQKNCHKKNLKKNPKIFFLHFFFFTKILFHKTIFCTRKLFSPESFFYQTKKPIHTKIPQPLCIENQANSSHKRSRNISTKNHTTSLQKKKHATSRKK